MTDVKKHIGMVKSTGRRCVVVFMQLPGKEDHALILDSEALPERWHNPIMDVLDSVEGQQERNFYNILGRRIMPDTGETMLESVHRGGYMRPEPIENIVMLPMPNWPVPLAEIVKAMNGIDGQSPAQNTQFAEENRFNRIQENQNIQANESQINTARGLLMQASDLEVEAYKKREQAYRMAPSLRPQTAAVSQSQAPQAPVAPVPTPSPAEVLESLKSKVETPVVAEQGDVPFPVEPAPVLTESETPADFADGESAALYAELVGKSAETATEAMAALRAKKGK
jgi:hypothetical protein